jgi:Zn ribbon nucleic-acid-binding protein
MDDVRMDVKVELLTDEKGFIGRKCPQCKKYFKVKFGTGLHGSECNCPYCGFAGDHQQFATEEQVKYAKSVAMNKFEEEVLEPILQDFERDLKRLEDATRHGLIQIKVESHRSPMTMPLNTYQEKEVETYVKCDHCGLEFEVYGVFANCPDCKTLNAAVVFGTSIEVSRKRIKIGTTQGDPELQEAFLEDALSAGVSAFDGLGKALQTHYPSMFKDKRKNLFQNLEALGKCLTDSVGKSLSDIVGKENYDLLWKMFQVRHVMEHNMGVVDADCIKKVPDLQSLDGRKYVLTQEEVERFLSIVLEAGNRIFELITGKETRPESSSAISHDEIEKKPD